MTGVPVTWQRIENWLMEHAPNLYSTLPPGATEAAIAEAEARMTVRFPDDLRESLRLHDGEVASSRAIYLIGGLRLLALKEIYEDWDCFTELLNDGDFDDSEATALGPVRPDWWNARWLPITSNDGGDHLCVDLDPLPGGASGQIIEMWHDWGQRKVLAESYTAWLSALADDLESGRYHATDDFLEEVAGWNRKG